MTSNYAEKQKERNMKRSFAFALTLAFALILIMASPPLAATDEFRLGYANLQRALNESEEGKQAKKELEKETKELEEVLNAEQEELKKLKEELDAKGSVWNSETREAKEREFVSRGQAFQKKFMQYREDLNKKLKKRESEIVLELHKVVQGVAEEKGLTYVFESSLGVLLHAPEGDDITDEVIETYNKSKK